MSTPLHRAVAALACGLIFGVGLTLSGMTDPSRVRAFLDIAGAWDASLLLVLGSAVITSSIGFRLTLRQTRPLLDTHFHLPPPRKISVRLILGWVLFGIGWGLVGLCPGPAITDLSGGMKPVLLFCVAMAVGMALQSGLTGNRLERKVR